MITLDSFQWPGRTGTLKDGAVLRVGDALSVTSLDYVVVVKLTDSIIDAASVRLREGIVNLT
jgi:hypothetical protein